MRLMLKTIYLKLEFENTYEFASENDVTHAEQAL